MPSLDREQDNDDSTTATEAVIDDGSTTNTPQQLKTTNKTMKTLQVLQINYLGMIMTTNLAMTKNTNQ